MSLLGHLLTMTLSGFTSLEPEGRAGKERTGQEKGREKTDMI